MIKTLLVFDEKDTNLGSFFELCREELDDFFIEKSIETDIIDKNSVFDILLTNKIKGFNAEKFVFAAFTHGDEENLLQSGTTPFISISGDLSQFKNSFFYTFACEAGKILGKELVKTGCKCFIGYNKETNIWNTYQRPFIDTATSGLKLFYEGENTKKVFSKMINLYNKEIDKLYKSDFVIASILMENRDALIMYGDDINLDYFTT